MINFITCLVKTKLDSVLDSEKEIVTSRGKQITDAACEMLKGKMAFGLDPTRDLLFITFFSGGAEDADNGVSLDSSLKDGESCISEMKGEASSIALAAIRIFVLGTITLGYAWAKEHPVNQ